MAFTKPSRKLPLPSDPEALYRQLARTNAGPDGLWGHQTDLLRDWHANYLRERDVALELPTGAGKTLVGGLIAEWLRQAEREPVAYLCPNRQLAVQAATRLEEYGIPVALLIDRVRTWDLASRARFTTADAVAVSTYSHVFNSNPALVGTGTLILDDAHAGEQPVSSAWSLQVLREDAAYQQMLTALADGLDPLIVQALRDDNSVRKYDRTVFLVSPTAVADQGARLEKTLDDAVASGGLPADRSYTLGTLAGHIDRCLVYVSFRRILIRPFISPTASHSAFDDPGRRVYMSATLGAGGELERAFGRTAIKRMPVPRGWDKQGTGRRFFVFPEITQELAANDTLVAPWLKTTIEKHGRAAVLAPSDYIAGQVMTMCLPTGYVRLDGHEVEKDMTAFTACSRAVLDLANRYDGVDLPDDTCRLLILASLPAQGDLQERFLYDALGAGSVLQERVRARVIQGSGRATRNTKDHATVVVLGDDLTNFLLRNDVLAALREELQAEITFGMKESLGRPIGDVNDNIATFLAQGDDWLAVEGDIVADRDSRTRKDPPGTAEFAASAPAEVAAIQAWWEGDLPVATKHARSVLDALDGQRQARRYAALWHYLASCWTRTLAARQGDPTGSLGKAADGNLTAAREAGRGTTWLSHLAAKPDAFTSADQYDDLDQLAAQQILNRIRAWSHKDKTALVTAKANLAQTRFKPYEAGLRELGAIAGATEAFDSGNAQAAPDSTWIFGDQLWLTWEAKSEADPATSVAARHAREASGHLSFVKAKRGSEPPTGSFTAYVTPQTKVDHAAKAVCDDSVYRVDLYEPADLLASLERATERVRALGPGADQAATLNVLKGEDCLPSQWISRFTRERLNSARENATTP